MIELDITTPLELPTGRQVLSLEELVRRIGGAGAGLVHVVGAEGCAAPLIAETLHRRTLRRVVLVAENMETARRAADDLAFVSARTAAPDATVLYAASETSPYAEVHPERSAAMDRTAALHRLARNTPWNFLVLTAASLVRRVPPATVLLEAGCRLAEGDEVDLDRLTHQLSDAGYLRTPVVEDAGTFAVRGGLLDVWPPGAEEPARLELYGDLVLSLRAFDPESQRSQESLRELWLPPARDGVLTPPARQRAREVMRSLCDSVNWPSTKTRRLADDVADGRTFFGAEGFLPAYYDLEPLWTYLPEDAVVVFEEPAALVRAVREHVTSAHDAEALRFDTPHFPVNSLFVDESLIDRWVERACIIAAHRVGVASKQTSGLAGLEAVPPDAPSLAMRDHADLERVVQAARESQGRHGVLEPLLARLQAWADAGLRVTIAARVATQADRLVALLSHRGVDAPLDARDAPLSVVVGSLARGVIAPVENCVFVTEEEIFGHRAHRKAERKRSARALLEDLRALVTGDYVVHVEHGIGRYLGLERKSVGGASVELLAVEYLNGDKLYVPVHRLNQVQKYSGGDATPRLDRLGGQTFAKTKAKVQRRVREMADELLRLYAERAAAEKIPVGPPDDDFAALEATFPYEETPDQAAAIADVLRDLESNRVMDRLVCGDVGFGKTEVAVRAAFRNALAGRQTALLCPTTVLAQQHYLTFQRRLRDYPIELRVLSRFQSKQQQAETVRRLRDGTVDIVVGTHRLLSKDVHFKHLGLLVVDEEHRFGVGHKERLKQLRTSVDVLTLTATPIPRTLQLAVGGLRDMSVINTPPVDRRAIRTITSQFDDHLIAEAVARELSRGGQIFYVYNRVEGIYERAAHLQELVPRARIAVGHGQLSESLLERTMLDFIEGKHDILVATAIIESGLDIPRANTMIVDRADLFGLAQLYQLRGRVGRSSERAYCYLLVPPLSQLTDEARYRIEALERYTELGTGFQVATLDMELRGFGNLLGGEQSGFVASVGFDLFCRMLEEATHELRGEPIAHEIDPELTFDVDVLLPDTYIEEIGVRLSLYKRLSSAIDESEVAAIAAEMEDRFGPAPLPARRLVDLMRLKTELRRLRAFGCEATSKAVTLHLRDDTPLDAARIGSLIAKNKGAYRLTPDGRLTRRALHSEAFSDGLALADRMLEELAAT